MSGIGAIIDGAFKGYQFGEGVKDQKRRRKIEDEKLDWAREDRDYLKKKRGWEQDEREYALSERERQAQEQREQERLYSDAYTDAERAHEVSAAPNPAETVEAAPTAPALPGTTPSTGRPGRSMRPNAAPSPDRTAPDIPAPQQDPEPAPRSMRSPSVSTRGERPPRGDQDAIPQAFLNDPVIAERLNKSTLPPERAWAHMPPEVKEMWREADNRGQQAQSGAASADGPGPNVMQASPDRPSAPRADQAPVTPSTSRRTMRRQSPMGPEPASDARIDAEAAARSEDPNVEAARAASVKTMQQSSTGKAVTKKQQSKTFLDTYREVAVPQIIQHHLENGEIEKAKSFETWIQTAEAQQMQEDFGQLTYSLSIGDLGGSLDHISDMYESVNDGYSVVRDKSRFETYDNGQPSKLVVVVEDADGNEFDWVVEDQGDLAAQVLGIVNPASAHEYLMQRNEAAVAARADRAKSVKDPITRKEVTDEVKRLKDDLIDQQENATIMGRDFQMPNDAELERQAVENLRNRQAELDNPRSYQPRQPVPDWQPTQ